MKSPFAGLRAPASANGSKPKSEATPEVAAVVETFNEVLSEKVTPAPTAQPRPVEWTQVEVEMFWEALPVEGFIKQRGNKASHTVYPLVAGWDTDSILKAKLEAEIGAKVNEAKRKFIAETEGKVTFSQPIHRDTIVLVVRTNYVAKAVTGAA